MGPLETFDWRNWFIWPFDLVSRFQCLTNYSFIDIQIHIFVKVLQPKSVGMPIADVETEFQNVFKSMLNGYLGAVIKSCKVKIQLRFSNCSIQSNKLHSKWNNSNKKVNSELSKIIRQIIICKTLWWKKPSTNQITVWSFFLSLFVAKQIGEKLLHKWIYMNGWE